MSDADKQEPMDAVLRILDLEPLEVNLFRGISPKERSQQVFGGQVIGQAMVAASRTVDEAEERTAHSLHAYFLRRGDPKVPIIYEVDRIRDGRSFTTRRVVAIQHGQAIFTLAVSYHKRENGFEHQIDMPDLPGPEDLRSEIDLIKDYADELPEEMRSYILTARPFEFRPVNPSSIIKPEKQPPVQHTWFKATSTVPDEPILQQCVLAYASDMTLLDTCTFPHGVNWFHPKLQMASLDHAMWFHHPFRVDEWMLYTQDSPAASGARGFNRGAIYTRAGKLVASVAQEGLFRMHD